jgi:hypothetical protein
MRRACVTSALQTQQSLWPRALWAGSFNGAGDEDFDAAELATPVQVQARPWKSLGGLTAPPHFGQSITLVVIVVVADAVLFEPAEDEIDDMPQLLVSVHPCGAHVRGRLWLRRVAAWSAAAARTREGAGCEPDSAGNRNGYT